MKINIILLERYSKRLEHIAMADCDLTPMWTVDRLREYQRGNVLLLRKQLCIINSETQLTWLSPPNS